MVKKQRLSIRLCSAITRLFFGEGNRLKPALISLLTAAIAMVNGHAAPHFEDGFIRTFQASAIMPMKEADRLEAAIASGQDTAIHWQEYSTLKPTMDLRRLQSDFGYDNVAVFIRTEITVPEDTSSLITAGYDDSLKLFLNGGKLLDGKDSRQCIPDAWKTRVRLPAGKNLMVLRVDNKGGSFSFALRVLTSSIQENRLLDNWYQAKPTWGKNLPEQEVSNLVFSHLTKPSFLNARPNIRVKHGIMTSFYTEQQRDIGSFFDGSRMPVPDFVDFRCATYMIYDAKTGNPSPFLTNGLSGVANLPIDEVVVSPIRFVDSAWSRHPGVESDITAFFQKKYPDDLPEMMRNAQGKTVLELSETVGRQHNNRFYYSYHDERTERYMTDLIDDFMDKIILNPAYRADRVNFRYPGSIDWYYPVSSDVFDYSAPAQKAFIKYLKEKYPTLEQFNSAHGMDCQAWDDIIPPPPPLGQPTHTLLWYEWQDFRSITVTGVQRKIFETVRKKSPDIGIVSWLTTSLSAAARDGVILDRGLEMQKEYPSTLMTLTCFDFMADGMPLSGELFGQLALAYNEKIAVEPLRSNPASYQKTFFNLLRFPVSEVTWLYNVNADPLWMPWIIWVLNQRPLADELAGADLRQAPLVNLLSYSDLLIRIPEKNWDNPALSPQIRLYQALQSASIHLPMITDHSLSVDLSRYEGILLTETEYIQPAMVEKIGRFVEEGGTAVIWGNCGLYDMKSFERNYPLLRRLGVDPLAIDLSGSRVRLRGADGAWYSRTQWKHGKGTVIFDGNGLDAMLDQNGLFTAAARGDLKAGQATPSLQMENEGLCASFEKRRDDTVYLGFMNICDGNFTTRIRYLPAANGQTLHATELVSGQKISIEDGWFSLHFDTPWQIQVLKLETDDQTN